jgi:hypothetical protein
MPDHVHMMIPIGVGARVGVRGEGRVRPGCSEPGRNASPTPGVKATPHVLYLQREEMSCPLFLFY